ncbi:hypothetical protein ACFE04_020276 [Oxalis oulophora]
MSRVVNHQSIVSTSSAVYGEVTVVEEQFPAGLKVLVVDDDITCLMILEKMLRRCSYHVTTCSQAIVALSLLREKKGFFDVILSDVHMPDMDGFKLLEHVGLEMDLPVIMMSADGRTCAVMKGIRHGACDYLIKPIREEELKNIWQHVVRKKCNKDVEHSSSFDEIDRHKRGNDEAEYASSMNELSEGVSKAQKKRNNCKEEDDCELDNEDPSSSKKPRVVWSVELHQQFVNAVNQLGIDKAVPKRILELMNVPGLTRENVASHLQKFRLYLKRLSGVLTQQSGLPNNFCGPLDSNVKFSSHGRFDIQALAASGQIPPQTLAALQAELLGLPTGNIITAIDQPAILQASSLQGVKCLPNEHRLTYGQHLVKCPANTSKSFPQSLVSIPDVSTGFRAYNNLGTAGHINNHGMVAAQNNNVLADVLQKQPPPQQSTQSDYSRLISVQPSCHVVPTQSYVSFQPGNSLSSVSQNSGISVNNSSFNVVGRALDRDMNTSGVLTGLSPHSLISSPTSSCSLIPENICNQPDQSSSIAFKVPGQFIGKRTSFPSRFAVDDLEPTMNSVYCGNISQEVNGNNRVKQEPTLDGFPMMQQFLQNDLMGVFTD